MPTTVIRKQFEEDPIDKISTLKPKKNQSRHEAQILREIPHTDLEVGCLVEVNTNVYESLYGVIRWIGIPPYCDKVAVGVELDEPLPEIPIDTTDGFFEETKLFDCGPGRGLFVLPKQCAADRRFMEQEAQYSATDTTAPPEVLRQQYGGVDCPVVEGTCSPKSESQ